MRSLVRPGPDSRTGVDSFGFELLIPAAVTELEARALAYLVYRTLRRSGIRWALWRPDTLRVVEASTEQRNADTATDGSETVNGEQPYRAAWEPLAVPTSRASTDLTTVLVVLPLAAATVLAVGVAPLVTIPAAVLLAAVMLLRSRRLR